MAAQKPRKPTTGAKAAPKSNVRASRKDESLEVGSTVLWDVAAEGVGERLDTRGMAQAKPLGSMYEDYFLEYASYVILDRAVPYVDDGFKPVQRRILHAMAELDDGRFTKAANIIGSAMQFHPHGDASIGDAMVGIGQKGLLFDIQGNWGNVLTGDSAAAPRYIEARLSKFAKEVVFNPKTTEWQLSYDGRKQEPVTLPVKFPLLLAQGADGIAVGLSTKILPHNFVELIEASIALLRKRSFTLVPDFISGGMVDVSDYRAGERGGRVRVRARIVERDKKTLAITEVPYSTTTQSLIDSILKANDKGKIKIKQVEDNTARNVEIVIHLAPGVSPDVTIDALYAFTDCEVSLAPNCCVIVNDQPRFTTVDEVLRLSVERTVALLKLELEIRLEELEAQWHFASLEKIFIEKRIYRVLEEADTFEQALEMILAGLKQYIKRLRRPITDDDIIRLTEIRIKRISKFDSKRADEAIAALEAEIAEVNANLSTLTDYAVKYYQGLLKTYGKGRERRTEVRTFDVIEARAVAAANVKLYVNRAEGFVGSSLKKDEFVADCSDLDEVIVFRGDGVMQVSRVSEKAFFGKNIVHVEVFKRGDDRMVYHLIYQDGKHGNVLVKRFQVGGVTRDKEYHLTRGTAGTQVLYFSANPNGESEVVSVTLKPNARLRKTQFDFDFTPIAIKGRQAAGNILSRNAVRKVIRKSRGASTLGGRALYFDTASLRLNAEGYGHFIGQFEPDDQILVLYADGSYELTTTDLGQRFDSAGKPLEVGKFYAERIITAIYQDGADTYLKRFAIETSTAGKKYLYLPDETCKLLLATSNAEPVFKLKLRKGEAEVNAEETVDVMGWKARGKKLPHEKVLAAELLWYQGLGEVSAEEAALEAEEEASAQPKGTLF